MYKLEQKPYKKVVNFETNQLKKNADLYAIVLYIL